LKTIQLAGIYADSKTFVDQPMAKPILEVLLAFRQLGEQPSSAKLKQFVWENFLPAGIDTHPGALTDWAPLPKFLSTSNVTDAGLRVFARSLHYKWPSLTRSTAQACRENCTSSLIQVPHVFLVPGGRFREFYYWDTYFILHGMLVSGLTDTAKGMIKNMLYMVEKYGFVPNGARIYYLNRSQPPLLTQMVSLYVNHTGDREFLTQILPLLDREYAFWQKNRVVDVITPVHLAHLNIYRVNVTTPRPEAYLEDWILAQKVLPVNRASFYADITSAAESGWDFSSRWYRPSTHDLLDTATRDIIPADLNAILYANEQRLAQWHLDQGQNEKAKVYKEAAVRRRSAMMEYLFDPVTAEFRDYNLVTQQRQSRFYASVFAAAYFGMYEEMEEIVKRRFVESVGYWLRAFPGGVPTGEEVEQKERQQWDFPNAWPPSQHFAIFGLKKLGFPTADQLALGLAQRWLRSNYCAWKQSRQTRSLQRGTKQDGMNGSDDKNISQGDMFEKYDSTLVGESGHGGEYNVQEGFGWTNGVILRVLMEFGDTLGSPKCPKVV